MSQHFVYMLMDGNQNPVYIGRSVDVARRLSEHARNPRPWWFDLVREVAICGPFTEQGAKNREWREINRHQPLGNEQGCRGWLLMERERSRKQEALRAAVLAAGDTRAEVERLAAGEVA